MRCRLRFLLNSEKLEDGIRQMAVREFCAASFRARRSVGIGAVMRISQPLRNPIDCGVRRKSATHYGLFSPQLRPTGRVPRITPPVQREGGISRRDSIMRKTLLTA